MEDLSKETLNLTILTLQGTFTISTRYTSTILQLKSQIIKQLRLNSNQIVKLIFRGKLLEDGNTLDSYGIKDGNYIHCNISSLPSNLNQISISTTNISDEEPQGFDRLRSYGFSEEEIQQFRSQFHTYRLVNSGFLNSSLDSRQLRSLEEEWMDNGVDNRSVEERHNRLQYGVEDRSSLGSHEDLFKGMVMGFLLGIIMLLWLPDNSLTLRSKVGIIVGISVSISFGMLRLVLFG